MTAATDVESGDHTGESRAGLLRAQVGETRPGRVEQRGHAEPEGLIDLGLRLVEMQYRPGGSLRLGLSLFDRDVCKDGGTGRRDNVCRWELPQRLGLARLDVEAVQALSLEIEDALGIAIESLHGYPLARP